jgi:hypothetical protein
MAETIYVTGFAPQPVVINGVANTQSITVSGQSAQSATGSPSVQQIVVSGSVAQQGPQGDPGAKGDPGTTDYNALSNKPALATVATSGSYTDLTNKPTIPTVTGTNTGDETTATIKTKLGITTLSGSNTGDQDLSGYATTSALTTGLATKQPTLVSGTNIKTINGTSVLGSGDIVVTGSGGTTNLSQTLTSTSVAINSDTGTDVTIAAADTTNAGVMMAADRTKLTGIASGATANSSDATLLARANHTGTQTASTISDFNTAADARITNAAGSTIATLSGGKIPTSQIPAVGLVTVQTAASQAAQLALTTQEGDVVVRTDTNVTYMRNAGVSGTMTDFTLLNTPTDAVTSVNSQTGTVVLAKGDVGLGNVDNTSDATKNAAAATLTNKNLSSGTNTFPTFNQNTTGTAANVTGTVAIANGGTGVTTLPSGLLKGAGTGAITAVTAPTGAIVGTTDTQTLTGKTLTAPVISSISNTGTLTLPTTTDTLVGRATTDTLTNKTISGASNTLSNISADSTIDGTTNKVYTATEKTKLAAITGTNTGDQVLSDATLSTSDITTNNVSTTKHGFVPKAPNVATQFLDGTGAWSTPAGTGGGGTGDMVLATAQTVTGAKTFNAGTLLDKGTQVFNVKAYGATGDGTTDDSTNIQSAITAAQTAGGTVFFPSGTYVINATLTISADNVTILGSGWGSVLKVKNATNIYAITIDNAAIRKNLAFRDFKIDGNRLNQTTGGGGISGPAANSTFDRIWFSSCKAIGLNLTGTSGGTTWGYTNQISRNLFDTVTPTAISTANNDENYIFGNVFNDITTVCIIDTAGTQLIEGNVFVGGGSTTTGIGIQLTSARNIVQSNVFDGVHEQTVKVSGDYNTIVSNQVSKLAGGDATKPAIQLTGGSRNVVTGNNITGGAYYTYAIDTASANYTRLSQNYAEAGTTAKFNRASTDEVIDNVGGLVGINTQNPSEKLTVNGNFSVRDVDTPTKGYRFRTSGSNLDLEFAGAGLFLSGWNNADYTGTQRFFLHLNSGSADVDAYGTWRFQSVPFGSTTITLDPGSGTPLAVVGDATVSAAGATSTSVVTNGATQTLTSKTLTSPVINNPTFTGFGAVAVLTATTAALNTTETVLVSATIPTAVVGTTYRITLQGTTTSTVANVSTFTLRAGTAGTTADASIATATVTAAATGTSVPFRVVIEYTLRTNGTTGNGQGLMQLVNNGTTGIAATATAVAALTTSATFNTTTATKLDITYKSAATTTTTTFQNAIIEIIKP